MRYSWVYIHMYIYDNFDGYLLFYKIHLVSGIEISFI